MLEAFSWRQSLVVVLVTDEANSNTFVKSFVSKFDVSSSIFDWLSHFKIGSCHG